LKNISENVFENRWGSIFKPGPSCMHFFHKNNLPSMRQFSTNFLRWQRFPGEISVKLPNLNKVNATYHAEE